MKFKTFLISIILLGILGCENSTEPIDENDLNAYMSLHIGDIRQFHMPYSSFDTIYTLTKVTGKTFRSDGTEVFITEWYTYNLNNENKYLTYDFIRDGYYITTKLDSTKTYTYPGNPYDEQKLAKINPIENETWLQIEGYYNPDSSQYYLTAKHLDYYETPAGKFKDVFCFINTRGEPNTEGSKTYYAKYYGYLGIAFTDDIRDLFIVNYLKINGKEVGNYIDMSKFNKNNNIPEKLNPPYRLFGIKK